MYGLTCFFPCIVGPYRLPQLVASATSLEPTAVPPPLLGSGDEWLCFFILIITRVYRNLTRPTPPGKSGLGPPTWAQHTNPIHSWVTPAEEAHCKRYR